MYLMLSPEYGKPWLPRESELGLFVRVLSPPSVRGKEADK